MSNNIKTWAMVIEQIKLLKAQEMNLRKLAELGPEEEGRRLQIECSLHLIAARLAQLDGKSLQYELTKYEDDEV